MSSQCCWMIFLLPRVFSFVFVGVIFEIFVLYHPCTKDRREAFYCRCHLLFIMTVVSSGVGRLQKYILWLLDRALFFVFVFLNQRNCAVCFTPLLSVDLFTCLLSSSLYQRLWNFYSCTVLYSYFNTSAVVASCSYKKSCMPFLIKILTLPDFLVSWWALNYTYLLIVGVFNFSWNQLLTFCQSQYFCKRAVFSCCNRSLSTIVNCEKCLFILTQVSDVCLSCAKILTTSKFFCLLNLSK